MILFNRAVEVRMPTSDLEWVKNEKVRKSMWERKQFAGVIAKNVRLVNKPEIAHITYVCISWGSITATKNRSLTARARTAAAVLTLQRSKTQTCYKTNSSICTFSSSDLDKNLDIYMFLQFVYRQFEHDSMFTNFLFFDWIVFTFCASLMSWSQ